MTKIELMNQLFLGAKTVAHSGASLAAQTAHIMSDMGNVLDKLAIIQSDREAAGNLHLVIGDEGLQYVMAVAAIFAETKAKLDALEAGE